MFAAHAAGRTSCVPVNCPWACLWACLSCPPALSNNRHPTPTPQITDGGDEAVEAHDVVKQAGGIAGGAKGQRATFAASVQFSITDPAWGGSGAPKVGLWGGVGVCRLGWVQGMAWLMQGCNYSMQAR